MAHPLRTLPLPPTAQWLCRLGFLAAVVIVCLFSLQAAQGGRAWFAHADKFQHALAYGVIAGLGALAWPRLPLWTVWLAAALLGVGVEIGQGTMALGRDASVFDAVANASGAALALWGVSKFFARQ